MIEMREGSFRPTSPKGMRTKSRILDAARSVFARVGFVDATMSDIAAASRLSAGGLYRYFMSKEDVFAAVVGDLLQHLYHAHTTHGFSSHPYEALLEASRGYLAVYHENREVMRAFVQAVAVNGRFREMWWTARRRYVMRFVKAARSVHGRRKIDGIDMEAAVEAMACMVEQAAYLWWAQETLARRTIGVEEAARVVTRAWYLTVFNGAGTPTADRPFPDQTAQVPTAW